MGAYWCVPVRRGDAVLVESSSFSLDAPMARRKVSTDLKARIPVLFLDQGRSVEEICEILGVAKSMVYQTLAYIRKCGTLQNPLARQAGRPCILTGEHIQFIRNLLDEKPTLYLDEIQDHLARTFGIPVSLATLVRTLRRIRYSSKAVVKAAAERDELLRAAFMNRIAQEVSDPSMLMFGDESAVDQRAARRKRGWAPLASRCIQRACFVRGQRYSLLPILTIDGLVTFKVFEGSVTTDQFVEFLHEFVVGPDHVQNVHLVLTCLLDTIDYTISWPTECACPGQLQYPPCRSGPCAGRR